ncbi:type II toxin-antitoxin system mRNA interferase toxin, RelE/StbE family, partial [Escherichia coli]
LEQVLQHPRIDKNRLRELHDCYKIKLRASGYRLVYQVRDQTITVFVVAVGKRERSAAYDAADKRL